MPYNQPANPQTQSQPRTPLGSLLFLIPTQVDPLAPGGQMFSIFLLLVLYFLSSEGFPASDPFCSSSNGDGLLDHVVWVTWVIFLNPLFAQQLGMGAPGGKGAMVMMGHVIEKQFVVLQLEKVSFHWLLLQKATFSLS